MFDENPGLGEVDIEHILMHEYGHVLGFRDDISPWDNINTLMTQGQGYWSRIVEDPLRKAIHLMYSISPCPGLPIKETNNEK